jgi:uncharacterized protein YjbJ (UPF0337 family)
MRCFGADYTMEKEKIMNRDTVKGNWKQFKGKVKEKWGKLTDDELDQAEGKAEQIVGILQKKYGMAKEEAERKVKELEESCNGC